ncbi:hypothetical protein [Bradyrhizobium elkanii]|uniref:hypothetical protein n=1 Tax=Bradyrhizobium elkanii TaxID=29448 RepID=UPI0020A1B272|nr:hypothetical protein [Bradyrhizobium elkanii]MCP1926404.1 hypothetical protein [Bradyrhizobium elkanii]
MARAVLEKTNERSEDGKTHPFTFLLDWAVKLHFIVAVDDTASINPGATLISPLPAVGSVGQSRSVGIGVGLMSEAVRQEEYEYLMSFAELRDEFKITPKNRPRIEKLYNFCQLDQGLFLESELGLKALVDAALEPVKRDVLRSGPGNIGPGAAPTPQGKLPDPAGEILALKAKRKANKELADKSLAPPDTDATRIETQTQAIINNVVKPLYGLAAAASFDGKCLAKITLDQNKAIISSIGVSTNVAKYYLEKNESNKDAIFNLLTNDYEDTVKSANHMIDGYQACARQLGKQDHKSYDPISTIGQTVNFFVTSSGSVTPTWKLINVTAPLANTFLSASRKDTNSVIISMGRPVVAADGTITASQSMNNQILAAQLGQAISQQRIFP